MGGGATAGGGRATRALRLLLLLVLALAAVEYLFGSILDASPLRTYLYTPLYNATQPTIRNPEKQIAVATWSSSSPNLLNIQNTETKETLPKNMTFTYNTTTIITNVTAKVENVTIVKNITISNDTLTDSLNVSNSTIINKLMEGIKTGSKDEVTKEPELPLCDVMPPNLGPVPVDKTELQLSDVETEHPAVQWGGRYKPPNCTARHKVAIIVPYRDREQHLAMFLNHMHPFLMKQQIEYGIFVIEQEGNKDFNRAKLMNVGFAESQKLEPGGWSCFIFHDIDLLPLDTRNLYSCPKQPRHMSASIDKLHFMLPYEDLFGGVSALTREQFEKVNGFSNKYWGWGGEDDDMFYRLKKMKYHIGRYRMSIARYAMLDHKKSSPNPKRYQLLSAHGKTYKRDGLSTLEYELVQLVRYHLYTYILANIDEHS